jgi:PhzF family phenazine biosynthesis protein
MEEYLETYIVDSFTDETFKGNPAGVCVLKNEIDDRIMLSIAKELGLSETAFIRQSDEPSKYSIRYFSPKMEIPLCGHATLASAQVLFEKYPVVHRFHFVTIENVDLLIARDGEMIAMEFPVYDTIPAEAPTQLLHALGINMIVNSVYNDETKILLLEISDSKVLEKLTPDFEALYRSHHSINGVLVTAPSNKDGFDFESRYFWPWSGTNEDPVTGGTHTFLAKYWSEKLHKTKMKSFQCSERTGYMEVELLNERKFIIRSKARIVLEGKLRM